MYRFMKSFWLIFAAISVFANVSAGADFQTFTAPELERLAYKHFVEPASEIVILEPGNQQVCNQDTGVR